MLTTLGPTTSASESRTSGSSQKSRPRQKTLPRSLWVDAVENVFRIADDKFSEPYRPPPAANDDDDLPLMRRIDELFTAWPFLGSRRMTAMLRAEGDLVNRKRVRRLMRKMGIAAL